MTITEQNMVPHNICNTAEYLRDFIESHSTTIDKPHDKYRHEPHGASIQHMTPDTKKWIFPGMTNYDQSSLIGAGMELVDEDTPVTMRDSVLQVLAAVRHATVMSENNLPDTTIAKMLTEITRDGWEPFFMKKLAREFTKNNFLDEKSNNLLDHILNIGKVMYSSQGAGRERFRYTTIVLNDIVANIARIKAGIKN